MQEGKKEEILFDFPKLEPELQVYTIQQGIQARLNSNSNAIEAILDGFKYLYDTTTVNKSLYSQRQNLIAQLKQWAKEKFAPEYANLSPEELDQRLNKVVNELNEKVQQKPLQNSDLDELTKLIIANANPDSKFEVKKEGYTATESLLNLLISYGDVNLIKLLLAYGADANLPSTDLTALNSAISAYKNLGAEKTEEIIQLLLKHGAKASETTTGHQTPIFYAITLGLPNLTKILLKFGAKPNETTIGKLKGIIKYLTEVGHTVENGAEKLKEYEEIANQLKERGYNI